ncbi:MAG: hypothetical protein JW891_11550 [Candidatus Lokiarchaeota archaeon]|nr:hypothetical protein [Candidatus Lokiarchaeota archaeon]
MPSKSDNLDKIAIIAEIEELKLSQASCYSTGKVDQALKISERIIDLARKINLEQFVKEQQDYIEKIRSTSTNKSKTVDLVLLSDKLKEKFDDYLDVDDIKKAHELVMEFKQKYQQHYNLSRYPSANYCINKDEEIWKGYQVEQDNKVESLDRLEIQFYNAIRLQAIDKANDVIDRAWEHIYTLEGVKKELYQRKWGTLEHSLIQKLKYEEYEEVRKTYEKIEKVIDTSKKLEKSGQFEEAKNEITLEIALIKLKEMNELLPKLENRLKEITTAIEEFQKVGENIAQLELDFQQNLKEGFFDNAISNCETIISFSRSSGNQELEQKYQAFLDDIKKSINEEKERLEKSKNLKNQIRSINIACLNALEKKNVAEALEKYQAIVSLIKEMKKL